MDFDLDEKQTSDEEIIELTDIIEKGSVSSAEAPTESPADTSMSDLGNSAHAPDLSGGDDVDLDALLAQMDSDGGFSAFEDSISDDANTEDATNHAHDAFNIDDTDLNADHAAPSATNDMPDMSDVDALLAEMDMPPQPQVETENTPPENTEDVAEDMDALLGSLLEDSPPTSAPTEAVQDDTPQAHFDAPAPPQAAAETHDDLDSLFQDVLGEAPLSAAEVAQSIVSNDESSADISSAEVAEAVISPAMTPEAVLAAEDMMDIQPESSPIPDLSDDLDAILSASELETQSAATAASVEDTLSEEADIMADIMDVPPVAPAPSAPDINIQMAQTQETVLSADPVMPQAPADPTPAPHMDVMDDMAPVAAAAAAIPQPVPLPVDDARIDALEEKVKSLENTLSDMHTSTENFSTSVNNLGEIFKNINTTTSGFSENIATLKKRMRTLEDDMALRITTLQEQNESVLQSSSEKEANVQASLMEYKEELQNINEIIQQNQTGNSEDSTTQLTAQIAALESKVTELESVTSAAPSESNEEHEAQLTGMTAKIEALEQALEEAKERETSMKEIIATQITKLEGTVQSLSKQQEETSTHDNDALQEKITQLEKALEIAQEKEQAHLANIAQLEEKVQTITTDMQAFEQNMQENLEKMAATAAAKVLREEIMALLGDGE